MDYIDLALLCSVIGAETRLVSLPQPIKWKTNSNHDLVASFSRALRGLRVLSLDSHWLTVFSFLLIATLIRKALNNTSLEGYKVDMSQTSYLT